jgi:hypothetical protein
MKVCFKCLIEKPLTEFYVHKRMGDGHLNKCKECTKKDVKTDYCKNIQNPEWHEKERARGRDKYHRLGQKKPNYISKKKAMEKYLDKFPEKKNASSMSGNLSPSFEGAERHHWSYNDLHFKDVIWLTKKHHNKAHRFLVYDQERKMYRRYDTNELLDTKESHESFIKWCIETKAD